MKSAFELVTFEKILAFSLLTHKKLVSGLGEATLSDSDLKNRFQYLTPQIPHSLFIILSNS